MSIPTFICADRRYACTTTSTGFPSSKSGRSSFSRWWGERDVSRYPSSETRPSLKPHEGFPQILVVMGVLEEGERGSSRQVKHEGA